MCTQAKRVRLGKEMNKSGSMCNYGTVYVLRLETLTLKKRANYAKERSV
jgi:hypothetical protein